MEPIKIDISKYVKSGEGYNGCSYNNPNDPCEMLKMYNSFYDTSCISVELEAAKKVYDIGVPSPLPGELVTDGERLGIRFFRIPEKTSFARAIADNPDRIDFLAKDFAEFCRNLHSMQCPSGTFGNAKNQFLNLLEADTAFSLEEKSRIAEFINATPESNTFLHGDMHFGNAVISGPIFPTEGVSRKKYWIDLGYFAQGYYMFDLGMTYIICILSTEEFLFHDFHFHKDVGAEIWKQFLPAYFQTDDPVTLASKEQEIKNYAAVKLLLVEYTCEHILYPHYKKHFYDTLLK